MGESQRPEDSQREHERTEAPIPVKLRPPTVADFVEQYSKDLSEGGVFVRSENPMREQTLVSVEIHIKERGQVINGVGRVVWLRKPEEASKNRPAGMGLKFVKLTDADRARIAQFVDEHRKSVIETERKATALFTPTRLALLVAIAVLCTIVLWFSTHT